MPFVIVALVAGVWECGNYIAFPLYGLLVFLPLPANEVGIMLAVALLTNTIIYTNIWIAIEYGRKQVLIELNRESGEKPERSRHCRVEPCALCHWGRYAYLGKACKTMKPSQENCLF